MYVDAEKLSWIHIENIQVWDVLLELEVINHDVALVHGLLCFDESCVLGI